MDNHPEKAFRRVSHRMGAWKWGYPKGCRIAIVEYRPRMLRSGETAWASYCEHCDGITAASEPGWRAVFPEAFEHGIGSIHNDRLPE